MDETVIKAWRTIITETERALADVAKTQAELSELVTEVRAREAGAVGRGVVSMVYVPMSHASGHMLLAMSDGTLWLRHLEPAHWDDLTDPSYWYQVALPKDDADEK